MTTTSNGLDPQQHQAFLASKVSEGVLFPSDVDMILPIPPNYRNPRVPQASDIPNPGNPPPIGVCRDGVTPIYAIDPSLLCGSACLLRNFPPPHSQKCPGNGECFNILFEYTLRVTSLSLKAKKKAEEIAKIQAKIEAREEAKALARQLFQANKLASQPAKRKRGGQPGNQSATKHGFFSTYLTLDELALLLQALSVEDLDLKPEVALMRIKYLKYANDSRVPLGDFIKLARALTNMLKANTSIDRFYGPQEEDESAGEDNESGTDPETNDKSNRA